MVTLPNQTTWPSLGIGTWRLGESPSARGREVASIRSAIDIGYRVIDTAEMYGDGGAEEVVGSAIAQCLGSGIVRRDELVVVSKVNPHNAGTAAMRAACERSLDRLGLDHLDCYLLHWRGAVPLAETVAGFEALRDSGRIRSWGVSNFDLSDLQELTRLPGGGACAVNQIYLSLSQRGPAFSLLPWQQSRGIVTMAYSPLDQGALSGNASLRSIAARRGVSASQLALAWLIDQPGMLAIAKASSTEHLRENFAALAVELTPQDRAELDRAFAPPKCKVPLAML